MKPPTHEQEELQRRTEILSGATGRPCYMPVSFPGYLHLFTYLFIYLFIEFQTNLKKEIIRLKTFVKKRLLSRCVEEK